MSSGNRWKWLCTFEMSTFNFAMGRFCVDVVSAVGYRDKFLLQRYRKQL